jgi:hypothetical protein
LKHVRRQKNSEIRAVLLFLLCVSFLSLAIQKVMYDEVMHEFFLEYPFPNETVFIYLGLAVNAAFVIFTLCSMRRTISWKGADKISV